MNFLLEFKDFYKVGDKILIEYWYNGMITNCIIKEKRGRKYLISHNIDESKIKNAPDEIISQSDIIDYSKSS
jgi:hypothetical protein